MCAVVVPTCRGCDWDACGDCMGRVRERTSYVRPSIIGLVLILANFAISWHFYFLVATNDSTFAREYAAQGHSYDRFLDAVTVALAMRSLIVAIVVLKLIHGWENDARFQSMIKFVLIVIGANTLIADVPLLVMVEVYRSVAGSEPLAMTLQVTLALAIALSFLTICFPMLWRLIRPVRHHKCGSKFNYKWVTSTFKCSECRTWKEGSKHRCRDDDCDYSLCSHCFGEYRKEHHALEFGQFSFTMMAIVPIIIINLGE